MRLLYFDFNTTTPLAPSVQEAMLPFLGEHYGHPLSAYALGRAAHEAVEDARCEVANLLGADPEEIVFTSGCTESCNLALKGVLLRQAAMFGHVVFAAGEHPAVSAPIGFLERLGCGASTVRCDRQGRIDPADVEMALRPETVLVSIMHASEQTGVIQPLAEIAEICHERDILLHTDAAQTVGKVRTLVDELQVDLLSLSAHKFYGPKGVGALYVRRGVVLEPLLHGSGNEAGLRAGTENVPGIVGLGKAARLVHRSLTDSADRLAMLRDRLEHRLRGAIGDRLTINGGKAQRLPNTASVNFPDVAGEELLARVPEICASTGASRRGGSLQTAPALAAMGISPAVVRGNLRLSVGWFTSEEDVERAASLLIAAWEDLR